jgi:hypothetical protein
MDALDIHSARELEDLCITTIYANLLTGKLSPHTQTFQITSCNSRDLPLESHDYTGMITTLTQWSQQCTLALSEITTRIRDIQSSSLRNKRDEEQYEKDLEKIKEQVKSNKRKGKSKSTSSSSAIHKSFDDEMDLMQEIEGEIMAAPTIFAGGDSPTGRKRKLVRPPFA